jgi:hypothetical protein
MPRKPPDLPETPHSWFDWAWFDDWEAKPSPSGPPPSDEALRRKARRIEKGLGVRLFGVDYRTSASGLVGWLVSLVTVLVMALRDRERADPVLLVGLLGTALAYFLGLIHARDVPAPAAPADPTPTPNPES